MSAKTIAWIHQNFVQSTEINIERTSYGLKHIAEWDIGYLTEKVFTNAMISCGYQHKQIDRQSHFNVSESGVEKLERDREHGRVAERGFYSWLLEQTKRDAPIGDFARDAKSHGPSRKKFSEDGLTLSEVLRFLEWHTDWPEVKQAARDAWVEYQKYQDADRGVYLIRCTQSRLIKIGVSNNVQKRLASLQTSSPTPLELVSVIPGGGRTLEKQLHAKFADRRVRGEWFELCESDIATAVKGQSL